MSHSYARTAAHPRSSTPDARGAPPDLDDLVDGADARVDALVVTGEDVARIVGPRRAFVARRAASLLALVAVLAGSPLGSLGCASYAKIPDVQRDRINAAHDGQLVWLKQSLYVGAFYDDDRYQLVHPNRFDALTYLKTAEGDPILPKPPEGIIPAGTRVRIERIEWPTGEAIFRRPLYTPRYTTWIFLRVARDRGDTTFERDKKHILLMPSGVGDEGAFESWLARTFSTTDTNPWIRSLPREQQLGLAQKRAVIGMHYDALTSSMGFPDRITRRQVDDGGSLRTVEIAVYGPLSVVLDNGVVARVDDLQGRDSDNGAARHSTPTDEPPVPLPADPPAAAPSDAEPTPLEEATPPPTTSGAAPARGAPASQRG